MKKIYALAVFTALLIGSAFSQSQGPMSPTQAASYPSPIGRTWTTPLNALASDGMYATAAPLNTNPNCSGINCFFSTGLVAGAFGFSIPLTATIDGIVAEVQRWAINGPNAVFDSTIRIIKGGTITGPNKANMITWAGNSPIYAVYGSPTDLWGTTWTPTDINGPGFGLYVSAYNNSMTLMPGAMIDHIRITVYYTMPVGISQNSTSSPVMLTAFSLSPGELLVNYQTGNSTGARLELFNILGANCYMVDVKSSAGSEKINTSALKPGIYFLRMKAGDAIETKKLIIGD